MAYQGPFKSIREDDGEEPRSVSAISLPFASTSADWGRIRSRVDGDCQCLAKRDAIAHACRTQRTAQKWSAAVITWSATCASDGASIARKNCVFHLGTLNGAAALRV